MRFLLQCAAVIAAAGLLFWMQRTTPGYAEITGPIPLAGKPGETVEARSFAVKVEKLVLAEKLRYRAYGRDLERDTSGIWAVVVASLEGRPESTTIGGAMLRSASGLRYEASRRVQGAPRQLGSDRLEPGLARRGIFVFELPRDEAQGVTLQLAPGRWPRLDTLVEIAIPREAAEQAETLDLKALTDG
ncbi:hypothetical protein [Bosea sp. (in: a-proteobacteria)]|jgi:hypothetical protein|uniref:hypothetical protein n=1 Tax=Bosea sp. (in: a-proteobacteria) TaxID=1871050 RepID=UPI003F6E4CF4